MANGALIKVRDAAAVLGVHENTLRRWEEKGLVRAVKLPTGVRRFLRDDIERLRTEMYHRFMNDALEELEAVEQAQANAPNGLPTNNAEAKPERAAGDAPARRTS